MPRTLRPLLSAMAAVLLLTGCLTIEENYTFKKDGSGTMEYVVDMSALGEMLKSLEALGEGKGDDGGPGDLDMKDQAATLKSMPGISKVKVNKKEKYVQRLTFRFKDIHALNGALNVLMPDSTGTTHDFFRWDGSTLVRTNNRHALEMGDDMGADATGDSTDPTAFLQRMHYKYSFTFAEAIRDRQVAEGVSQESPEPRQLKLDTDWSVIMKDPAALDLRITLDK
ncbi:MAG: hypothetical protein IPJ87_02965 [Flavobacteriales bacterium]|mgnify:FL=1|nr:hypothetical protein [Flavobacteriales bacterium]MBK7940828.1 hypothetical protein [Flavobacteriales bacterium]MBK9700752.1 hypothetical protein [Flavobacteriales bacterium]